MFSVDQTSRSSYYKYLAKLNFEAAEAADKVIGFFPGYEAAAPPPVMTLCAHSIELSLKAYLLDNGVPEKDVKAHKHDLLSLWRTCADRGAASDKVNEKVLEIISDLLVSNRLRYGEESDLGKVPVYGPLSELCRSFLELCGAPTRADIFGE
tara:strand:- start:1780 stop:2235 length:456 start_codon:yes stop_codon:yes gene_type:complete